ncbi:hypothetical protein N7528_008976 [Penicillium herquei]|nr:hypothetical protein N7528_008976 [Penicillium herquei]
MSDPFSLASGAVGIISLGIQLCNQITDYAEAWRSYDEDIEGIGLKAESLKGPLRQLRSFVEDIRVTDSDTANDLVDKASELERRLKSLENRLAQAKPVISDSLKEKVRNRLKKFSYPLQARDALRNIKSDLDSVQSTIQLALTIFNAQQAQSTYRFQEKTFKLIEDIHLTVSHLSRNCKPAPALLKSLCDRSRECASFTDTRSQSKSIAQEDLDIEARLSAITPFAKRARQNSTKTIFQYYSGWLHREITLSFSLTSGAGAFSISPVLELRVYRGEDCWARRKSSEVSDCLDPTQRLSCDFEQLYEDDLIRDCQQAMSAGKFGPCDIDSDGFSVISFLIVHYNYTVSGFQRFGLSKFIRFLIECGFKLDNPKDSFVMELFCVKWTEDDYSFALHLLSHGASVNFIPRTKCCKENVRRILRWDSYGKPESDWKFHAVLLQAVDLPEIAKVILGQSEPELREILQSGRANANDNMQGLSLLMLAVGWPEGVRILLDFGVDASKVDLKRCEYGPVDADDPESAGYSDSITLLLQAGCILRSDSIMKCRPERSRSLMIDEYAKRRKKLYTIAQACLSLETLDEILGPGSPESLLDVHASRVYANLIKNGCPVAVDRSLEGKPGNFVPVYHHAITDNTEPWDGLYQAGFRDIDIPDSRGLTPLMVCGLHWEFNEKAAIWLVDKGATLSTRLPSLRTTVAHLLSSRVTENLHSIIAGNRIGYKGRLNKLIGTIKERRDSVFLSPSAQDCCVCACCEGACTTLLVALRHSNSLLRHSRRPLEAFGRTQYSLLLSILIDLTDHTKTRDRSIIRLFTFEALGLRHTCCCELSMSSYGLPALEKDDIPLWDIYAYWTLDDDEVERIQDEDQLCYGQLEKLVIKFNVWFDELELNIIDFLKGPWQKHMTQILSSHDPYNEDHILGARNLGIFLEPAASGLYEAPPFFHLLGDQVEEVEDDSVDNVSNDEDDDED